MKPDQLTAEMTADRLDDAVGKTAVQKGCPCPRVDTGAILVSLGVFPGRLGKRPTRHFARRLLHLSDLDAAVQFAVDTPAPKLNEHRILHDLFQQKPDLESHSKNHEGDSMVDVLQMRG